MITWSHGDQTSVEKGWDRPSIWYHTVSISWLFWCSSGYQSPSFYLWPYLSIFFSRIFAGISPILSSNYRGYAATQFQHLSAVSSRELFKTLVLFWSDPNRTHTASSSECLSPRSHWSHRHPFIRWNIKNKWMGFRDRETIVFSSAFHNDLRRFEQTWSVTEPTSSMHLKGTENQDPLGYARRLQFPAGQTVTEGKISGWFMSIWLASGKTIERLVVLSDR